MDRDTEEQIDSLIGDVKLQVDNYTGHFSNSLEEVLNIEKKDLSVGFLKVH